MKKSRYPVCYKRLDGNFITCVLSFIDAETCLCINLYKYSFGWALTRHNKEVLLPFGVEYLINDSRNIAFSEFLEYIEKSSDQDRIEIQNILCNFKTYNSGYYNGIYL